MVREWREPRTRVGAVSERQAGSGNARNRTSVNLLELLRKQAAGGDLDFLREAVAVLAEAVMEAEVAEQAGAAYGERSPERITRRNGYRPRRWDTRAGSIELQIPKLRQGSYFPALLEPRRRAERALLAVVQQAYVEGVSTRRVDDLVRSLGCEGISKSQVSRICAELDTVVTSFLERPLDGGPYRYLWLDALTQRVARGGPHRPGHASSSPPPSTPTVASARCWALTLAHERREEGRIAQVSVVVATAVNADGKREVLGIDVGTSEDGAFWLSFLRGLVARGLSGVELVTSDAHQGLRAAIATVFGGTSWQRCRTHFMRNLLTRVPKSAEALVATTVRTIFQQPSAEAVHAQHARVVEQLEARFPAAAAMLAEAAPEVLAFTACPVAHWKQVWSNNPQERLNREIRRRTDVVGIFPNRAAVVRLVGAVLAEQHDEWAVARRYMTMVTLLHPPGREVTSGEEVLLQAAS